MKTTVGGGCGADGCARRGLATRHRTTNHKQKIGDDFFAGDDVMRIESHSPKRPTSLLGLGKENTVRRHFTSSIYNLGGNKSIQERASDV
jgi:hypothetical protein